MPRPRTPQGDKKIETSQRHRVYWHPGEPHPLDVLDEELAQTRAALPGLLEELLSAAQQTVHRLSSIVEIARNQGDLADAFAQAENTARLAVLDRFSNRKHVDHLLTAFALQRQKRLQGRLRTIEAALTLVNDLLAEEESLSQEFLTTWRQASSTPPAAAEGEPEQEPEIRPSTSEELETENSETDPNDTPPPIKKEPTKEELRTKGIDQPLQPLVSSADHARRLLRDFEARLPELRRQLSTGQGWFEVFSVPKRHYKQEVPDYAKALVKQQKHNTPIPAEILAAIHPEVAKIIQARGETFPKELREFVYDITLVGPYVKYRWTEQKHTYTISLGLLDDYPPFPFVPEGF